jgi:MFS family permease
MALGSLFLAAGFGILPLGDSYNFVALTVVIWTIGEMLVFPLVAGFIANRASDENRGKYMGLFGFTFSLSFVGGPLIGSWIYDYIDPSLLWYSVIFTGIVASIGFLLVERRIVKSG